MCCQILSNNTKDIKKEIYIEFPKFGNGVFLCYSKHFFTGMRKRDGNSWSGSSNIFM